MRVVFKPFCNKLSCITLTIIAENLAMIWVSVWTVAPIMLKKNLFYFYEIYKGHICREWVHRVTLRHLGENQSKKSYGFIRKQSIKTVGGIFMTNLNFC